MKSANSKIQIIQTVLLRTTAAEIVYNVECLICKVNVYFPQVSWKRNLFKNTPIPNKYFLYVAQYLFLQIPGLLRNHSNKDLIKLPSFSIATNWPNAKAIKATPTDKWLICLTKKSLVFRYIWQWLSKHTLILSSVKHSIMKI